MTQFDLNRAAPSLVEQVLGTPPVQADSGDAREIDPRATDVSAGEIGSGLGVSLDKHRRSLLGAGRRLRDVEYQPTMRDDVSRQSVKRSELRQADMPVTASSGARDAGPRHLALISLCIVLASTTMPCQAAPEEIQVYLDDMKAPGQASIDFHNNYVFTGRRAPDYAGEQPPEHVYRLTPELNYGLTDVLELGLYLLSTRDSAGGIHGDGAKVRLKYIAPHASDAGIFWGVNFEVGRTSLRVSETPWNAELKGILGWRNGAWLVAFNPNIDGSLSRGGPATADIDFKVAYSIDPKTQVGLEAYNELGPARHLQSWSRNSKTAYAVIDREFGAFDLNLGIGRGLTHDADRWTIKFIVGVKS